jgi:hypothetical protein
VKELNLESRVTLALRKLKVASKLLIAIEQAEKIVQKFAMSPEQEYKTNSF